MTAFIILGHFKTINTLQKKFEMEKFDLIAEREKLTAETAKLAAERAKLAADKARLESERNGLLAELRRVQGAKNMEAALKTQKVEEILLACYSGLQSIYQTEPTPDPDMSPAGPEAPLLKPAKSAQYRLTSREELIIKGIVAGKTNKEIGAEVFLVEGTVTNEITKLFNKFNIESRKREDLARFAVENELVD